MDATRGLGSDVRAETWASTVLMLSAEPREMILSGEFAHHLHLEVLVRAALKGLDLGVVLL